MKECTVENATFFSPEEFQERQKTVGKPLYMLSKIALKVLKLLGAKEHDFYGICKYYTIGLCWGGLEFGTFFVCGEYSAESTKAHELGHGLQNANVGGWSMIAHFIGSACRYWWAQITNKHESYYEWYYEDNATKLGEEYIKRVAELRTAEAPTEQEDNK